MQWPTLGPTELQIVIVQDITELEAVGVRWWPRPVRPADRTGRPWYFSSGRQRLVEPNETVVCLAVLWIDLDELKEVNDHYGHGPATLR